jgi:hypothetical protein
MFDWKEYCCELELPIQASELHHAEVVELLGQLQQLRPAALSLSIVGHSAHQRPIYSATLGRGSERLLAWSQMHGNEPTHTAVLLRLLEFLQRSPEHPTAAAILAECQLTLVPMLNPDGVELYTRRNAQQIDINRDALQLQSPEGRVLRELVVELQPQFALNLHNQNPRTAVGAPPQPAAVSLLVPPLDPEETSTPSTLAAEKLAACFRQAVEPHCLGMLSRYDADYMPRCFGEWVQQRGIATLTIEAGGGTTPDTAPLVKLHFLGLLAVFEGIAAGSFHQLQPESYRSLPRSSEQPQFDRLVTGVQIPDLQPQSLLKTDLGINLSDPHRQRHDLYRHGVIEDLGDLSVTSGKLTLAGEGLMGLPGRILFDGQVTPVLLPKPNAAAHYLASGVTSLIGCVDVSTDVSADDQLAGFERLRASYVGSMNLGFLARFSSMPWSSKLAQRLEQAIAVGLLGAIAEGLPPEALPLLRRHSLPVLSEETVQSASGGGSFMQLAASTAAFAEKLRLSGRGQVRLGATADLLFLRQPTQPGLQSFDPTDLHQVWVGGNVAFAGGKVTGESTGVLLVPC